MDETPEEIRTAIRSLADYEVGWLYGEGVPATKVAVDGALLIHEKADKLGYIDFQVVPDPCGGAMLSFWKDKVIAMEVLVGPEGGVSVDVTDMHEDLDMKGALYLLQSTEHAITGYHDVGDYYMGEDDGLNCGPKAAP